MNRNSSAIVHGFGTAVTAAGSLGVCACTVGLIVALVRSGNVCAALAVGIALSAALVYARSWCQKLAALNEMLKLREGMEGRGDGDE